MISDLNNMSRYYEISYDGRILTEIFAASKRDAYEKVCLSRDYEWIKDVDLGLVEIR